MRYAILGGIALSLAACGTVPKEACLLTSTPDKRAGLGSAPASSARVGAKAFDPHVLRVLSWNIHKLTDPSLPHDLARLAARNDLLLLQEAVLETPLRETLEHTGFSWQMADAFSVSGLERGVLVAARVPPVDGQALRTYEPLYPLPKTAVVTHYRLAGRRERLAVANLHGVNFSMGLGRFREQLNAVAGVLMQHHGPMIVAGDFNTWSQRRNDVLNGVTRRLGLVEVKLVPDDRRIALGQHLDHFFVRGISVVDARSVAMKSSDHNPLLVRLAVRSE